ncbi:Zinc knuckle CX2CX4HX4C protein [Raphanus sativus]|nr:Zinc knuckle CX2CX4HX4C protein [Raphanus sativus]
MDANLVEVMQGMSLEEDKPITAAIWVRLRNIPVNYLTYKTIDAIADGIGHVEVIEFDPEKPQLQDYVRVQVTIDLNLPVRDKKSLSLPGGRVEYIDVEYERVRKKCYHCMRLTHEKLKCPLFQGNKSKGKEIAVVQSTVQNQSGGSRQHHNDLTEKIMPLLAPSVPPGFAPQSTLVAPEVFEEMRFYMNCIVPEERRVREAKMRKTLDELSRDPVAQRSCLRLERAPLISRERTGEVGHVFDFCTSENGGVPDVVESSLRRAPHQYDNRGMERDGSRLHEEGSGTVGATGEPDTVGREVVLASPQKKRLDTRKMNEVNAATSSALEQPRFTMGYTPAMSADKSSKSRGTTRSKSSWCRRDQKKRRATGPDDEGVFRESEEGPLKRKATDEDERWCNKPEVMEVVRRGWNADSEGTRGTVSQRIRSCRRELAVWKKSSTSNSSVQIRRLREVLESEEKKQFPDLQLLASTRIELENAYQEEEAFLKAKSKNTWLQVGDKNTRVFHGWVETRRMKNRVQSLLNENGVEHYEEEQKGEIAIAGRNAPPGDGQDE